MKHSPDEWKHDPAAKKFLVYRRREMVKAGATTTKDGNHLGRRRVRESLSKEADGKALDVALKASRQHEARKLAAATA